MYGASDNCVMSCAGDDTETCGGYYAISVYFYSDIVPTQEVTPSPAVTPMPAQPTSTSSTFVGCYVDPKDDRLLDDMTSSTSMTMEVRTAYCKRFVWSNTINSAMCPQYLSPRILVLRFVRRFASATPISAHSSPRRCVSACCISFLRLNHYSSTREVDESVSCIGSKGSESIFTSPRRNNICPNSAGVDRLRASTGTQLLATIPAVVILQKYVGASTS